jgi:hypothetical protein
LLDGPRPALFHFERIISSARTALQQVTLATGQ